MGKEQKKKKSSVAFNVILTVVVLVGLGVISYPTVSDWWNRRHATQAIESYVAVVESINDADKQAIIDRARLFNESLSLGVDFKLDEDRLAEYYDTLDITGTGIMGYINIPSINVNLPIYHGVEDSILQVAIGHIPGSSFPVGGETTHAIVSGHRGLPSAMLFTDLDKLKEGDVFTITVMSEVFTYQVDQIRIVLPEDVSALAIESGKDYVTMVTCTPYGVNSHRLLVRGSRIENALAEEIVKVEADATKVSPVKVMLAVAAPLIVLSMILSVWQGGFMAITNRSHTNILKDLENTASKNIGGNEDEK